MRESLERELKLVPGEGFRLPDLGQPLPDRAFVSTYVDTPELRLARHGVTFRHRLEAGTGLWQLKLPRGAARLELEEPGPPARPPPAFLELLVAYLRGSELVRVARLRTRRQGVRADGAEIVEDSVSVYDGQRVTSRFRELEVELVEGGEETLRRLERALRAAGAEPGAFRPKLHRALDLAYLPEPVVLERGAPPLEALRVALLEQYDRLLVHDPGTRLGSEPEDLHQLRVATRRARAFLRAARPLLDREWERALRDELGWLGSALGPARDLDVLLERLAGAAPGLVEALERERVRTREAALAALADDRYLALLDRLEAVEPTPAKGAGGTLAGLWWDEARRLRKRFGGLRPASSDDELHAARIDVKRARYAAELAAHELGKPGQRFVEAAKILQDVLGEHQDAAVAADRIARWAEAEPGSERAAGELLARERKRQARPRAEWPRAWASLERRVRKARP